MTRKKKEKLPPVGTRPEFFDKLEKPVQIVDTDREIAASIRVRAATDHLYEARDILDRACRDLASIIGASPAFRRIAAACDEVKRMSYALSSPQDPPWKLDHQPTDKELKPKHHACGSIK